jgi:hypothetical protein
MQSNLKIGRHQRQISIPKMMVFTEQENKQTRHTKIKRDKERKRTKQNVYPFSG